MMTWPAVYVSRRLGQIADAPMKRVASSSTLSGRTVGRGGTNVEEDEPIVATTREQRRTR